MTDNTSIPAGQIVEQSNTLASLLQVSFGTTLGIVSYDGLAPSAVGLYQINVVVPSIPSSDYVPLAFTLGGVAGTQTLWVAVQNGALTPQVQSLTLSASSVAGGATVTGSLVLSAPAPAGGAVVALASFSSAASVPATFENKFGIGAGVSWETGKEFFYNPEPGQMKTILTKGGMGSYKTSSFHIPFGLRFGLGNREAGGQQGSLIIIELTGETSSVVLPHRKKYQIVSKIDPTGVLKRVLVPERKINGVGAYWLDPKDQQTFGTRATKLAMGCTEELSTVQKYFDRTAQEWIEVVTMCVATLDPRNANLGYVARIFHGDPVGYCRDAALKLPEASELRLLAARFGAPDIGDVKSIRECIEDVCTQLSWLMKGNFAKCLSKPEIRFGDCRRIPQTISVCLSLESLAGTNINFLKYILSQILAELQSEQFAGDIPVAIIVDEFSQYPKMESVRLANTSLRKFHCFMALAVNDSLTEVYGPECAASFEENAGLIQYMSTKSKSGCENLSAMLGDTEVLSEKISLGQPAPGEQGHPTINRSYDRQRRRLMEPFEIAQNLGPRDQIVRMDGVARPILCRKRPYHETDLAKIAAPNPFFKKEAKGLWKELLG